jgi:hypothetical protein
MPGSLDWTVTAREGPVVTHSGECPSASIETGRPLTEYVESAQRLVLRIGPREGLQHLFAQS